MKRWINLYPPCDLRRDPCSPWRTTSWTSRHLADRKAKPGRIACIEVEFEPGDGLEKPVSAEHLAGSH